MVPRPLRSSPSSAASSKGHSLLYQAALRAAESNGTSVTLAMPSFTVKRSTITLYKILYLNTVFRYCKTLGHAAGRGSVSRRGKAIRGSGVDTSDNEMLCLPWRKGTDVINWPPNGWIDSSWKGILSGAPSAHTLLLADQTPSSSDCYTSLDDPSLLLGPCIFSIPATITIPSRTVAALGRWWQILADINQPSYSVSLIIWCFFSGGCCLVDVNMRCRGLHTLHPLQRFTHMPFPQTILIPFFQSFCFWAPNQPSEPLFTIQESIFYP